MDLKDMFRRKTDGDLRSAQRRLLGWLTYTSEDECKRMFQLQELSEVLEERGMEWDAQ